MSGESGLQFHDAIFFGNAFLDHSDDLDFEISSFSDDLSQANALDDGTFDCISGADLISGLDEGDAYKLSNGDSFTEAVERKCAPIPVTSQAELLVPGAPYANGSSPSHFTDFHKPSLDLEQMDTQGNGLAGLTSPTSPCVNQSGLMSSAMAASEKLNCLTLETMGTVRPSFGPALFDAKANVSRGFPQGASFSPAGVMPINPGGKRYFSSPMMSPTIQAPVSGANGISRFGASGAQDMASTTMGSNGMLPLASPNNGRANVMLPPASPNNCTSAILSPSSVDMKESADGMLGVENRLKTRKQNVFLPMHQGVGMLPRGGGPDNTNFVSQIDGDGDRLQPLPSMMRPPMQRSFSSHALGQFRQLAPAPPSSDASQFSSRGSQLDSSGRLSSPSSHMQPQLSDLQGIGMRPVMPSMRRVHSAGDIQTLNGMQNGMHLGLGGGTPPPSYEEGCYRVGKYSMEERKLRINRYQQKRSQRNFNKKIKYACRKTLADSRPRVRGRFAKNDEVDLPPSTNGRKHEDEDEDEGDIPVGEEEDEFLIDEDSSGDFSDMLGSSVKLEKTSRRSL